MTMSRRYSYFEFLLDKSGELLKSYLKEKEKDPPPCELCKQFIEKSLSVATSASLSQVTTEGELKVYEAQRIWQPLCLAMTVLSHLRWNLDIIQDNILLHLQQILMEELLKGYGISQIPKPEDFDVNKFNKKTAMVYLLYNRWLVRTITKYEELKEKDVLPSNLSLVVKEAKETQEQQIFFKIKEYRNLSLDILEKSICLEHDTEIPFPMPRLVTATEIIPQMTSEHLENGEKCETMETDQNVNTDVDKKVGITMKVPQALEMDITVSAAESILKICYDLGCYYFPKELYSDALRVFQKAFDIIQQSDDNIKSVINYERLCGYYRACCDLLNENVPEVLSIGKKDPCYLLEGSASNNYKNVVSILTEDNLKQTIPFVQRQNIEKEIYGMDKKDLLFSVCTLNFIRSCIDDRTVRNAYFQSLRVASKSELKLIFKLCKECLVKLTCDLHEERLKNGVRLTIQFLTADQRKEISTNSHAKVFLMDPSVSAKKFKVDPESWKLTVVKDVAEKLFTDMEADDRISSLVELKAKLTSCFEPETIKDILFELHEIPPEQSHAVGYECVVYQDIFKEVRDLLMYDTVHVCVSKAKQLSVQKDYSKALSILNICVETLDSYATRASPGCSVARVKNILHHELLWTELKLAETNQDRNQQSVQEAMRRSKACIHHRQQDPPPQPHIYKAIVTHLLNNKEYEFLVDAGSNFDVQVVDFVQLGFHLSSVVCGLQRGVEVLRAAAKGLWEAVLKLVGESHEGKSGPPSKSVTRSRGPAEDQHMWNVKCYIKKDEFISLMLKLKDDTLLSLLLSCLTSLMCTTNSDSDLEIKDSYTHLWPTTIDGKITTNTVQILSVLKPLCRYCLEKNSRNISWLRTIADVHLAEGDYRNAMKCYLEVGSITTSFFSRPVTYSVWDEKIYKNMILCCQKQKAYTQVIVFCQFTEPVDYTTAFKAIQERNSGDATDGFYDCLWDINILEYLIFAHDKRGELEKRKLAMKVIGQPELNNRDSPDILQQSSDIKKTRFLRTLTRLYWR